MTWENIKRQRGVKPVPLSESVSLGWKLPSGSRSFIAYVTVSKALVASLEWSKPLFLLVQRIPSKGLVRLSPSEHDDAYAGSWKGDTVICGFPLSGVQSEKRPAKAIQWAREGSGLILTMPDWAAPERTGLTAARQAQKQAYERMQSEARIIPKATLILDRPLATNANRQRLS